MSTEIYLGYPPENIKKWIKDEAERKYQEMLKTPLTFTAEQAGSKIKMTKYGSAPTVYLETSPTGEEGSWSDFIVHTSSTSTDGTTITLENVGDKVYFRAKQDNERFGNNSGYNYFEMTGKIAASGNLNTLLKADGSVLDLTTNNVNRLYCYSRLFNYCLSLTQAPDLPATKLAENCYSQMFYECTSLTQAPALPAKTLAYRCYFQMFTACKNLIHTPTLPATTLTENCYQYMFYGCISLSKAPALPAKSLANGCYYGMFNSCKSLTQAPELPATTLASSCYRSMFSGCTSLTSTPELPATTLADSCYNRMFYYCISLTNAPELKAETLADSCYEYMFLNSAIPSFTVDMTACTSVPSLPRTTLFSSSNKPYTVLVPASLYDEWIQATNWSTIASNIQAV